MAEILRLLDDLAPVLGPLGALVTLLLGAEFFHQVRKRRHRTTWALRPVAKEVPSKAVVEDHAEAVEDIQAKADETPHAEPEDITDEDIDAWASGK